MSLSRERPIVTRSLASGKRSLVPPAVWIAISGIPLARSAEALRRVGEQVVVLELVGDGVEDLDQLPDLVRREEAPTGLLCDLAEKAPRAARHEAQAAEADAVHGRLHRAGVGDDLAVPHRARGVGAVAEDDHRLAPGLVLDPSAGVVDGGVGGP